MTEAEARERAERLCRNMEECEKITLGFSQWKRIIEDITAALLEATGEERDEENRAP